jgi:small subunit ribosomal protein S10
MKEKIQIKLKSFDAGKIEVATKKIIAIAQAEKAIVSGPIPLPTRRERFTILKATHVYKKSREQFEIRTHKRLIVLSDVNDKLKDSLKRLKLSAGVSIKIKQI